MSEEKENTQVKKTEIFNENTMMERGTFTANGHTFTVKPVYLGEESSYLSEMTVSPVPNVEDDKSINDLSNKELSSWAIALFSSSLNITDNPKKERGFFGKLFVKLFNRNNYHYYDNAPAVQPLIKWIEKKVTCDGHKVKFYELERKYGLSKAEIEKLFIYFHELSGF